MKHLSWLDLGLVALVLLVVGSALLLGGVV